MPCYVTRKDAQRNLLSCLLLFSIFHLNLHAQKNAEVEVGTQGAVPGEPRTIVKAGNQIVWIAIGANGKRSSQIPYIFLTGPNSPCADSTTPSNSGTCQTLASALQGLYVYQFCPDFTGTCSSANMFTKKFRIKDPAEIGGTGVSETQVIALWADGNAGPAVPEGSRVLFRIQEQKELAVSFSGTSPCKEDNNLKHKTGPCTIKPKSGNFTFDCDPSGSTLCADPMIHVLDADGNVLLLERQLDKVIEEIRSPEYAKSNINVDVEVTALRKVIQDLEQIKREITE